MTRPGRSDLARQAHAVLRALAVLITVLAHARIAAAQSGTIAGTWESTIRTGDKGERLEPPIFAIYVPGGQFVELMLPAGRPRLQIPLDEMTRDELLARFRNTTVRSGTYSLEGQRLARRFDAHLDPTLEGATEVAALAVEPNAFVLRPTAPDSQSQVRFRRLSRGVANPLLVGAWERLVERDDTAKPRQPVVAAHVYYYSPDGLFASIQLPANRPKVDKPLERMTIDELLARFTHVVAEAGTYSVLGNRLTRTATRHTDPNNEGRIESEVWRIEDDVLVVTSTEQGSRSESRFRRLAR